MSTSTAEPSLLYQVAYIAAAGNETDTGNIERLINVANGAQESRIDGGTQLLAIRLAERLGYDNILLNAPVRVVRKLSNGRYNVITDEKTVSAKHMVVAMSPPLAARIDYDPELPAGRDQLTQRMPMGAVGKVFAIYERPWWRDMGLNGQVVSDTGTVWSTFDSLPFDGSFGAIMGFIEADEMRRLDKVSEQEIQAAVRRDLVNFFGQEAGNVRSWIIHRWDHEKYSRGGPFAYGPTGVLTEYGADYLRAPHGKIHFGGTETSPYWSGYMDGAIRAGERVAREILDNF